MVISNEVEGDKVGLDRWSAKVKTEVVLRLFRRAGDMMIRFMQQHQDQVANFSPHAE